MISNWKRRFILAISFYSAGGEALEQVAQRCGGYLVHGGIQDQTGQGSDHPDVAVGVPVHCRGIGLDDL